MEYAPVYKKEIREEQMNLIEKFKGLFSIYHNDPLNYYYYFSFRKYLYHAVFQRNFKYNYYIAEDYVKYIRIKNKKGI